MINSASEFIFLCWTLLYSYRYILDIKWFKQWKSYVGYESWDHYNVGEESANPGPIDNTPIYQGTLLVL